MKIRLARNTDLCYDSFCIKDEYIMAKEMLMESYVQEG